MMRRKPRAARKQRRTRKWPDQLVMTDEPENWMSLVEHIAELEDLLSETERDGDALEAAAHIRLMLQRQRENLRAIDCG